MELVFLIIPLIINRYVPIKMIYNVITPKLSIELHYQINIWTSSIFYDHNYYGENIWQNCHFDLSILSLYHSLWLTLTKWFCCPVLLVLKPQNTNRVKSSHYHVVEKGNRLSVLAAIYFYEPQQFFVFKNKCSHANKQNCYIENIKPSKHVQPTCHFDLGVHSLVHL